MLVKRGEDGAFAPEDVDVADEAVGGVVGGVVEDIEIDAKAFKLVCVLFWTERPGIAFGREHWRAGRVERAQSVHEWRMKLRFGQMVEIVRIFAQVDETAIAAGV